MAKVMVLGAGSFGTALALLCHRCGHEVTVWSHREEEANRLREEREQKKLLPGVKLPQQIAFTASLQQAGQQDLLILAVPSFAVRQTARQLCPLLQSNQIVVCVAKGLEQGSFHDFSTVLSQEIQCGFVGTVPCRGGQPRRGDHGGGFLQRQGGSAQGAGLADEPVLPRVCQR